MDTKLRRLSRSNAAKVFVSSILILISLVMTGLVINFSYVDYSSLSVPNYVDSMRYKRDMEYSVNFIQNFFERKYEQTDSDYFEAPNNGYVILFYATDGNTVYTNINGENPKEIFSSYGDSYYYLENGSIYYVDNKTGSKSIKNNLIYTRFFNEHKITLYFTMYDEYLQYAQNAWESYTVLSRGIFTAFAAWAVLSVFLLLYLTIVAGRQHGDKEIYYTKLDKIYSDIGLAVFFTIGVLWFAMIIEAGNFSYYPGKIFYHNAADRLLGVALLCFISLFAFTGLLSLYLSFIRKLKGGIFFKHTFLWSCTAGTLNGVKRFFKVNLFSKYKFVKAMFIREMIFLACQFFLVAIIAVSIEYDEGIAVICMLISLLITFFYVRMNHRTNSDITALCDQVNEISSGNYNYVPSLREGTALHIASQKLLNISNGFKKSVDAQVKSEKMKVDLITNVSHDLKTPLTSVISYIDLLSRDKGLSKESAEYVAILNQKADRLKNIVADLFDLAKATSGNVEVVYEELDLKKLIEQTLGDMEDKIIQSGMPIKLSLPNNPVIIRSDGKKLYRVFQNIIDNALKYSLKGTRIFIELTENQQTVSAAIKNTSSYEINFSKEEILERFQRGDKSRSTEGSGLGLSIAEVFTSSCGGEFDITIDGDLFKTTLTFPRVPVGTNF